MNLAARVLSRSLPTLVDDGSRPLHAQDLAGLAPEAQGETLAVCVRRADDLVKLIVAADGVVDRLLLLSASASPADVARLRQAVGVTRLVSDRDDLEDVIHPQDVLEPGVPSHGGRPTQWLITTSGTTGPAKVVRHDLASLTRTIRLEDGQLSGARWGLLYDPTRFAGLQVVLHALCGDGSLLVPPPGTAFADAVALLARLGCDHLSATPSLWRRILMHPAATDLPLKRVTLGGEPADAMVLGALRRTYPEARVSHIYASTEAGVGFTVTDGRPGFPAAYLEPGRLRGAALTVKDGMLWVRNDVAPSSYVGGDALAVDEDGFVATGDRVSVEDDRVLFLGRAGSGINVGGVTVDPQTVEAVLYEHRQVRLCRVGSRSSPVTGALVTADVVPDHDADEATLRRELQALCRERLVREAVPRKIDFVADLELSAAGKVVR